MNNFPLPAPVPILSFFLYIAFFIHLILVNLVLGSSLLIGIYLIKGKEKHFAIAKPMAQRLPYFMAFLIPFGVAPLLFIQALYPSLFYNSLINFSLPLFVVLFLVLLSYILLYVGTKKWEEIKSYKSILYFTVALSLSFVMFVFNNIFCFMEEAGDNPSLYLNSKYGFDFYYSSPTLMPRFLHLFFASIALSGLWVAVWGVMKLQKEPEQGRWQYRSGATYFSSSTILVIVTGLWWLMVLPHDTMKIVMGKEIVYTILFAFLIISSFLAFVFALLGMNSVKPSLFLRITSFLTAINIFAMIVLRDGFRKNQLKSFYDISKIDVNFQWIPFSIFIFFICLAVFVVFNTLKKIYNNTKRK